MAAITLEGLGKRFGDRWAVRDLDLEIEEGETFAIVGESGCGKTTTLRLVNRLLEPDAGRVLVNGRDVRESEPWELRRGIGYVIQSIGLFPHYDVRQNVSVVPGLLGWDAKRIERRVDQLLRLMGLNPTEFGHRYPAELSGGQRQRVGVARALAADPPIVLLDEPFGALDPITREQVQDEFVGVARSLGKTFVLITHDVFEAVRLGDRIAVMREGRVLQNATPADLVRRPSDEFVERMLGRHRYQLRLMTSPIRLVAAGADGRGPAEAPELDAGASAWDALAELEATGAESVQIVDGDERRWVSRNRILDSAG